jgi:hypothetical protein
MKSLFRNVSAFAFALLVAGVATSCHRGYDAVEEGGVTPTPTPTKEVTEPIVKGNPTHTLRGVVLNGNGEKLDGAIYTITRKGAMVATGTAVSNTFEASNLVDGDYAVVVSKTGYKNADRSLTLKVETQKLEDGTTAKFGQSVEAVFYLTEEKKGNELSFGAEGSDKIILETTKQDNGSGNVVTTTDESLDGSDVANEGLIEVTATIDAVADGKNSGKTKTDETTGDEVLMTDYEVLEEALADQGVDIDDFSFFLTGISSLEDAADVASDNGIASRALTRANTTLPGDYEILAGMAVNAGTVDVDFAALNLPQRMTIEFSLPDNDCKKAVTLYRTFKGDTWTPLSLTGGALPTDVTIDMTQDKKVVVTLSRLRTQSFALGVKIVESNQGSSTEVINATPIVNNATTSLAVTSIKYNAKAGSVLKNEYNGALTDFLRKIVMKKYSLRAVEDPNVEKEYVFNPVYQLPAGGTLFLTGWQNYSSFMYSIRNSNAAFSVIDYQAEFVYPYATYASPEVPEEPIETHSGGSSL